MHIVRTTPQAPSYPVLATDASHGIRITSVASSQRHGKCRERPVRRQPATLDMGWMRLHRNGKRCGSGDTRHARRPRNCLMPYRVWLFRFPSRRRVRFSIAYNNHFNTINQYQ
jgi:hypothetical protein